MFGNNTDKNKRLEAGITLIASNCELTGDIQFTDQLQVDGTVNGSIYALPGSKVTVTVSEKGKVRGEIRVPNVIVNGEVLGDIRSAEHLELAARARIKGNVYYNLIEMVKGARMVGQLVYSRDGVRATEPQDDGGRPEEKTSASGQATGPETIKITPMTPINSRGS